jgi:hypothetical protein
MTKQLHAREVLSPVDVRDRNGRSDFLGRQRLLFPEQRMQRVLQRTGLLQHQQQVAFAIAQLELVLGVLRVEVLQLELRGGQHLGQAIQILLRGRHAGLHIFQTRPRGIDVGFVHIALLRDRQDENQNDGAEPATNAVEKREAEDLGFAAFGRNRHGRKTRRLTGLFNHGCGIRWARRSARTARPRTPRRIESSTDRRPRPACAAPGSRRPARCGAARYR